MKFLFGNVLEADNLIEIYPDLSQFSISSKKVNDRCGTRTVFVVEVNTIEELVKLTKCVGGRIVFYADEQQGKLSTEILIYDGYIE